MVCRIPRSGGVSQPRGGLARSEPIAVLFPGSSVGLPGFRHGLDPRLRTVPLSSDGWLLMLALLISVWGAGAASAYDVAAGGSHTCVIDELGVVCWGFNYDGQSTVPGGLVSPTALAAGSSHTCAIDDNGVTCWGSDESGQSTVPAGLINPRAVAASVNTQKRP